MDLNEMLGPWTEPPAILVSGPSGTGKTTDQLKTFAHECVVIQLPGGARAWNRVMGLPLSKLRVRPAANIREAQIIVEQVRNHNENVEKGTAKTPIRAIVVDDLSLLALAEMRLLRSELGRKDNFYFHESLRGCIHAFAHSCRLAGVFLTASAHLAPPGTTNEGEVYKGGPHMPVAKLIPAVPHIFDTAIRVGAEDPDRKPFTSLYYNDPPSGQYVCKDRHQIVRHPSPMNLRELLMAVGYVLPRYPGLEWQDKLAEEVAGKLAEGVAFDVIWNERMTSLREKKQARDVVVHWRWAMQDGRDRYEIRSAEAEAMYAL